MEIGVLVRKSLLHSLLVSRSFDVSTKYSQFVSKLQAPMRYPHDRPYSATTGSCGRSATRT